MAMTERYHAELESAARQIREQREQSEAMAEHFRQNGLQLREACTKYVNDRETANREEMESLTRRLETNSQMMAVNNEMVVEHGQ
jgi:predicted phage gp36 major capsid-like protein